MRTWSTSATSKRRYGDKASPCLSPRLHCIQGPGTPLTRTADFDVDSNSFIHLIHLAGNPRASKILNKLAQLTESNALAKSSLITSVGTRRLWQHCTNSVASTKFSEMERPLMKPVWSTSMSLEICCSRREVSSFFRILTGQFCSDTGRKDQFFFIF